MYFFQRLFNPRRQKNKEDGASTTPKADILVQKANTLHLLLLLLLFLYSVSYTIINIAIESYLEAWITAIPIPFVLIEYVLFRKGYWLLSKTMNMVQVSTVVGILSLITTPASGILAFYIPILLGTQLTFMGKERRYAHYMTAYILVALAFFLLTDIRLPGKPYATEQELHFDQFLNFFGAALATTFEIIFILSVSNRIQADLFEKSAQLHFQNKELSQALQANIQQNEIITRVNRRFDVITSETGIGIWVWEKQHENLIWNDIMLNQFEGEISMRSTDRSALWRTSLHPDDKPRMKQVLRDLTDGKRQEAKEEIRIIGQKTGTVRILQTLTISELDSQGNLIQLLGSTMDITEQRHLEESITSKNQELEKTNQELDRFVYSVSHDLRSPLLSIKGLLNLMHDLTEPQPQMRELLTMALKSVHRLDDTIKEILEYSRNARLDISSERFDVASMVQDIFDDHAHISQKKMAFHLKLDGDPLVCSDSSRVHTLLRNLIGNAVKYRRTDETAPYVHVHIHHAAKEMTIRIEDNGEGITEVSQPKIFDMFYRGSNTGTGTGLGLYICKQIVLKLNGSITLASTPGKGSIFTVHFPECDDVHEPVSAD